LTSHDHLTGSTRYRFPLSEKPHFASDGTAVQGATPDKGI
jgi:hypothetical protein